jgi:hypothetical protein
MEIRVTKDYKTHQIEETYCKDENLYCPNCGKQEVWYENGLGDYYQGVEHLCLNCEYEFYLPIIGKTNEQGKQVIKQIKEKINE